MKKLFILFFLIIVLISLSYSYEKIVDYNMKVDFYPQKKLIRGKEIIQWKNSSDKNISELMFHLYLNAFKNEESTFMKEALINLKEKPYFKNKNETGWEKIKLIKVNNIKVNRFFYVQPDDNNTHDRTVLKVHLPFTVKPREIIQIYIEFESKLPKLIARTGYKGKFFLAGQWFPKLGVLQENGVWNCHQFHRNSEFFADFGDFYAEITLPSEYIVAGSGIKKEESKNPDNTKTYVYESKKVHDFAWTAYPFFKLKTKKINKTYPPIDTKVKLYTFNNDKWAVEKYFFITEWALEFFSKKYGKYPYPVITVIDPPPGAERAGGMEYPTFITGGRYSDLISKFFINAVEMITFHEFGHQYWYGMVATNEFEHAWLDEGLNTFSELTGLTKKLGKHNSLVKIGNFHLGDYDLSVISLNNYKFYDPIAKPSWDFFSGSSYSFNSYQRTSLTLLTLKNLFGERAFWNGMRNFFQKYKFSHPKPEDFFQTMGKAMGKKAENFLRDFITKNKYIDYKLEQLISKKHRQPSGTFGETFTKPKKQKNNNSVFYVNRISVVNNGNVFIPVIIKVKFENGKNKIFKWDGKTKWKKYIFNSESKILSAIIDPENKIALDRNIINNSKKLKPNKKPSRFLAGNFSFFFNLVFSIFPL